MKYNFDNLILYNEYDVYYKVDSYANDTVYIVIIDKPKDIDKFNLMTTDELFNSGISIVYSGTKNKQKENKKI